MYKIKRGEYKIMYEVLKEYTYDDAIGFKFYKKVIFDYDTEERYFCLTVQNCDCRTNENILLDFIYDSEEFEEKAQTIIHEYLLNDIADSADCVAYDLDIDDLIKVEVNTFDYVININNKAFKLFNEKLGIEDYKQLEIDIIDYVKSLATALNTK